MPVTNPEVDPIVAIVVTSLLHVPPVVASDSAMLEPAHTELAPVIAAGCGFTVIVVVV